MQSTIRFITEELKSFYLPTEVEGFVRLISESVFGLTYQKLILKEFRATTRIESERIQEIVVRLKNFEPIQYILGEADFYGLKFKVTPAVLIPRNETEELVDWILKSGINPGSKILDIGTGSGCIAVSLKKSASGLKVSGLDISEEALVIANENALTNKVEADFFQYDILNGKNNLSRSWDVIVSNPPYVRESEKSDMNRNVLGFEPMVALFVSDDDPLIFYRTIVRFANRHLVKGGYLFFEINENFGFEIVELLKGEGYNPELRKDIHGKNRMVKALKLQ